MHHTLWMAVAIHQCYEDSTCSYTQVKVVQLNYKLYIIHNTVQYIYTLGFQRFGRNRKTVLWENVMSCLINITWLFYVALKADIYRCYLENLPIKVSCYNYFW